MVFSMKGVVGREITAQKLKAQIDTARKSSASLLVLEIDTPGGSVTEAEKIINLLIEAKGIRFAAFVRKALSAGAAITLACNDIYVSNTSTLGAAVSYIPGDNGLPVALPPDVAEKQQSVWRAVCRKAADQGGHSPILAEGMVDPEFAITTRTEGSKVIIEKDGEGETLKAKGRILTMTPKEAVKCQLALATVADLKELASKLSEKGWKEATPTGGAGPDASQGLTAAQTEQDFYDLIVEKVESLGLSNESQTSLQKDATRKQWDAWYRAELRKAVAKPVTWTLLLREAKPPSGRTFDVYAIPPGSDRVVVVAHVDKSYQKAVAEMATDSLITLQGRLTSVTFIAQKAYVTNYGRIIERWEELSYPDDPDFKMIITLDSCRVGGEDLLRLSQPAASDAPAAEKPDGEAEGRKRIGLAETYVTNKMLDKAWSILRSVVTDFPDTSAAKAAQKRLDELKVEMDRQSDEKKAAGK